MRTKLMIMAMVATGCLVCAGRASAMLVGIPTQWAGMPLPQPGIILLLGSFVMGLALYRRRASTRVSTEMQRSGMPQEPEPEKREAHTNFERVA
jgi:hypothetical protein